MENAAGSDDELQAFLVEYADALREGREIEPPPELVERVGAERLRARLRAVREWVRRGRANSARGVNGSPLIGGRFRRLDRLADGGMGVVYRARDERFGLEVALKVMRRSLLGRSHAEDRFLAEARLPGELRHPALVPVYDAGRTGDGRPWFAMLKVPGQNFHERLKARRDPTDRLADWLQVFEQVARVLAHAHGHGVVHRDVKAENVMVGDALEVWLLDWGLAKRLSDPTAETPPESSRGDGPSPGGPKSWWKTQAGDRLGTPASMAPEQADHRRGPVGPPADVFALGSLLCEVLTGHPAYTGDTVEEVRERALRADLGPTYQRLADPNLHPVLGGLARRCLAVEPGDRFPDAGAVVEVMEGYRESLVQAERDKVQAETERKYAVRVQRWLLLAVALAATSAAGLGLSAYQSRRAARTEEQLRTTAEKQANLSEIESDLIALASDSATASFLSDLGLVSTQSDWLQRLVPALEKHRRLAPGPEADRRLSQALVRLADAYQTKGESPKALELLGAAGDYFAHGVAGTARPDNDFVYGLAVTRATRGFILAKAYNRTAEAIPLLRQAAEAFEGLIRDGWGDTTEVRNRLAQCRNNEANCLRFADPDAAVKAYRGAVAEFRRLAAGPAPSPGAAVWLVKSGSNLAMEMQVAGHWAEARPVHDEAAAEGRRFTAAMAAAEARAKASQADAAGNAWLRAGLSLREALAVAQFNRGVSLGRSGRLADAEAALRDALSGYEFLAEKVKENREFAWGVAMTRSELGRVLTLSGTDRRGEAAELLRRSRDWYASAGEASPNDMELVSYRGEDLDRAAELAQRSGQPAEALRLSREAVTLLASSCGKAGPGDAADAADQLQALVAARTRLGDLLAEAGDLDGALLEWDRARASAAVLAEGLPAVPRGNLLLASAEAHLAAGARRRANTSRADTLEREARHRLAALRSRGCDDPELSRLERELAADGR